MTCGAAAAGVPAALAAAHGPHRAVPVSRQTTWAQASGGIPAVGRRGHRTSPPAMPATTPGTSSPAAPTTTPPDPAATPAATTTAPRTTPPSTTGGVTEQWAGGSAPGYRLQPRGGSTVTAGAPAEGASDGRAAALTIPANAGSTPANAAEIESLRTFTSGSFGGRVRTPDCSGQPTTGAVTGIFTYGNDGGDHDGDGIVDNNELDIEILCARPYEVNLTIWTDYAPSGQAQRRVTRVVDLRSGRVLSTGFCTDFSGSCRPLAGAENTPASVPASPGFDSSAAFHEYRIDWSSDQVVFSVVDGGTPTVLWDYRGPRDRIPQGASAFLVNLWHTDDWSPGGLTAVSRPTAPLTALVDSTTIPAA